MGHEVTIAAASFSHLRSSSPAVNGKVTQEFIEDIRYVWLKSPSYKGNGFGRVLNMLTFVGRLYLHASEVLKLRPVDVVIASSTYPLDIFPAHRIARRSGAKLVFEVHDLWPLTPLLLGGMSPWHPYVWLLQRAEDFAYRNADYVVSLLEKADTYMTTRGMDSRKFIYIPNGIELDGWGDDAPELPEYHHHLLSQLRENGRLIVGYAGSHGLANALSSLIDAASILRTEPVGFVFVGDGPDKNRLQERVNGLGLTNVVFLPPVPRPFVPALLRSMDALFIGWKKSPLYKFGISPNKLLDYMMANRPVIHSVEAGNDPVVSSGCGISVAAEDPSAIAAAVRQLMRLSPEERHDLGARGSRYVLAHHDYVQLAIRFLDSIS
jgi:glycosyltransferase involved in cell wall biosynthesis